MIVLMKLSQQIDGHDVLLSRMYHDYYIYNKTSKQGLDLREKNKASVNAKVKAIRQTENFE